MTAVIVFIVAALIVAAVVVVGVDRIEQEPPPRSHWDSDDFWGPLP